MARSLKTDPASLARATALLRYHFDLEILLKRNELQTIKARLAEADELARALAAATGNDNGGTQCTRTSGHWASRLWASWRRTRHWTSGIWASWAWAWHWTSGLWGSGHLGEPPVPYRAATDRLSAVHAQPSPFPTRPAPGARPTLGPHPAPVPLSAFARPSVLALPWPFIRPSFGPQPRDSDPATSTPSEAPTQGGERGVYSMLADGTFLRLVCAPPHATALGALMPATPIGRSPQVDLPEVRPHRLCLGHGLSDPLPPGAPDRLQQPPRNAANLRRRRGT